MGNTRTERIESPAAWYGRDLEKADSWVETLSPDDVAELRAAAASVDQNGLELLTLTRDQFPLPTLSSRISALARELDRGRGFWLMRGLPIDQMSTREAATIYWGIGLHMGTPVSQNSRGHLLGHVTDEGLDIREPGTRGYQTRVRLPYHTDSSDVVGLLCLRPSKSGGLSSLVSSTTVFNEVLDRRPDLAHYWFESWYFDRRNEHGEGDDPFYTTPFATWSDELLSVRYVRSFVETALRHPEVPRRTPEETEFLDLVDEIANEPGVALHMDFQPGDIQFLSNYSAFHSRTAYEDFPEPDRKRHLLRLWIALDDARPLPADFGRGISLGIAGRGGVQPVPELVEADAGLRF